jgi:predicted transcriptional regulator
MTENTKEKANAGDLLRMTAEVAAAYVGNNSLPAAQLPEVIRTIYSSISALDGGGGGGIGGNGLKPIVPVKKSIAPDYIICLEDGKKLKMLKRHLRTSYGMTPEEYRIKWNLPADYPMVAPNYAAQRSAFAKKIGLGRKPGARKPKTKK